MACFSSRAVKFCSCVGADAALEKALCSGEWPPGFGGERETPAAAADPA